MVRKIAAAIRRKRVLDFRDWPRRRQLPITTKNYLIGGSIDTHAAASVLYFITFL